MGAAVSSAGYAWCRDQTYSDEFEKYGAGIGSYPRRTHLIGQSPDFADSLLSHRRLEESLPRAGYFCFGGRDGIPGNSDDMGIYKLLST